MECSICYNQIVDKVTMTCSGQHTFCFKCIIEYVDANSELGNCPNCRGGQSYIMLGNEASSTNTDFYSLYYFKKCIPILQKILQDSTNSCLISETMLITYLKNKKQLDIAHKLLSSGETIDTVVTVIKWNEKNVIDMGAETIGSIFNILRPEITRASRNGVSIFGYNGQSGYNNGQSGPSSGFGNYFNQ